MRNQATSRDHISLGASGGARDAIGAEPPGVPEAVMEGLQSSLCEAGKDSHLIEALLSHDGLGKV